MNEHEFEQFEHELKQIKPAPIPGEFMARLQEARPLPERPQPARRSRPTEVWPWAAWLRWVAPASAIVLALAIYWRPDSFKLSHPTPPDLAGDVPPTDSVE